MKERLTDVIIAPPDAFQGDDMRLPKKIPPKASVAIALRGFGLSNRTIARALGISEAAIRWYLKKYDPSGIAKSLDNRRKIYLSAMFETIALEALSAINAKDIAGMSIKDRLYVAQLCVKAIKDINAQPVEQDEGDETSLIEALRNESQNIINGGRGSVKELGCDSGGTEIEPILDGEPTDGNGTGVAGHSIQSSDEGREGTGA